MKKIEIKKWRVLVMLISCITILYFGLSIIDKKINKVYLEKDNQCVNGNFIFRTLDGYELRMNWECFYLGKPNQKQDINYIMDYISFQIKMGLIDTLSNLNIYELFGMDNLKTYISIYNDHRIISNVNVTSIPRIRTLIKEIELNDIKCITDSSSFIDDVLYSNNIIDETDKQNFTVANNINIRTYSIEIPQYVLSSIKKQRNLVSHNVGMVKF